MRLETDRWRQHLRWIMAVGLLFVSAVQAEEQASRVSLGIDFGPAFYRYTESGAGPFDGLETEWEDVALLVRTEATWETPWGRWGDGSGLFGLLRFHFITSAEDTETNNVGAPTTDLQVAYLFSLQPGFQVPFRLSPSVVVAPELTWDLDWYRQERQLAGGGEVIEEVFRHGPAVGGRLTWEPVPAWIIDLTYRHSFLIHVGVSNTFTGDLGFQDLETEGQRDVAEIMLTRRLGSRWSVRLGYRFELARIDASDTASRLIDGAGAVQLVQVQFPENKHRIHAALLSASFTF